MAVDRDAIHVSGTVDGDPVVLGPAAPTDRTPRGGTYSTVVTTRELRIEAPQSPISLTPVDRPTVTIDTDTTHHVPPGGATVTIHSTDQTVAFDSHATVVPDQQGWTVSFDTATDIHITDDTTTRRTFTIPPTPAGAAAAVSHAAHTPLLPTPARSHPSFRPLPPRLELDDTADLSDHQPTISTDDRPTIELPAEIGSILQVAPLAYYLGATVSIESDATPTIRGPRGNPPISLTPLPDRPPELLETVFQIDAQVRIGIGEPPESIDSLDFPTSLDLTTLREATPIDRLRTYLKTDTSSLTDDRPPWHLAAYLPDSPSAIPALPYLMDRLAHVYPPSAKPLSPETLMERSLDDFYRSRRPVPTVDLVEPTLQDAGAHAWIADSIPVDAFRVPPDCVGQVGAASPTPEPELAVMLILNDPDMVGEEDTVAESYRTRSAVPVVLDHRRNLTTHELERALRQEVDLLHFVGHCEPDGLVCTDGNLAAETVDDVGPRTVFLNACGSYHEGAALVKSGVTAAAITYRGVLDGQAETVGAAFARLVTRGFSLERTVSLARRRVMMGMDYGIVGDGTHRLTAAHDPVRYVIDPTDEGYRVRCETFADGIVGDLVSLPLPGHPGRGLRGSSVATDLDRSAVIAMLDRTDAPVIYDGTFAWPDDLAATLRDDPAA